MQGIQTKTPAQQLTGLQNYVLSRRALSAGQAKAIKFIVGAIVFSLVLFNFSYARADYSAGTLVSMTNDARARNGLGALSENSQLASAAYAKAQDMLTNNYFAHTSPTGKTPWDFINGAGYSYAYAGENLAIGYADASELFNAWMASATHRENILNPDFREIGVAVVSGTYEGVETIVVAQELGTSLENSSEQVASESNTSQSGTPTTSTSTVTKTFEFVRDKSNFNPQTIFSGEEVTFEVTITGDVSTLEVQAFDQKINLLEVGSVTGGVEKTYSIKEKIEKEGSADITVAAADKNGNRENLPLGKLEVKKTTITKETGEKTNTGLVAGFKQSLRDHWLIYLIIGAGLVLSILGFIIFRRVKFGKIPSASWRF